MALNDGRRKCPTLCIRNPSIPTRRFAARARRLLCPRTSGQQQKITYVIHASVNYFALKMRLAHRLLMATPASIGSKSSLSEALALLPPLQLYRRILRVHRKLDPEMRILGDSYVKKEFREHRNAENPLHIVGNFI